MKRTRQPWWKKVPGHALQTHQRSLYGVYQRALAVCAAMEDAERHMILVIGLAYALEIPQEKFEAALRRYRAAQRAP